jgi:hypothetical protein
MTFSVATPVAPNPNHSNWSPASLRVLIVPEAFEQGDVSQRGRALEWHFFARAQNFAFAIRTYMDTIVVRARMLSARLFMAESTHAASRLQHFQICSSSP